jgi:zinc/manganese transport system substrate-binding protein
MSHPTTAEPAASRSPRRPRRPRWRHALPLAVAGVVVLATGCDTSSTTAGGSAGGRQVIRVVAAENFWGSIAAQLGGAHVSVTSIIDNPDADPHDYEPTPADGRTIATARYAIVNGVGYDPWAPKLLAANPDPERIVLTVGDLVGVKAGGNPHRWYSPPDVERVIDQIVADYKRLDPADASAFDQQKATFETTGLKRYHDLITTIRQHDAGTPVGASESIFAPLADALGLRLLTPESFLDAISEGTDPTAKDKALIDRQLKTRQIKVYVYNSQNATPDVQAQVKQARAAGIPVATVTETLTPAGASFQDWQATQLAALQDALARAGGR